MKKFSRVKARIWKKEFKFFSLAFTLFLTFKPLFINKNNCVCTLTRIFFSLIKNGLFYAKFFEFEVKSHSPFFWVASSLSILWFTWFQQKFGFYRTKFLCLGLSIKYISTFEGGGGQKLKKKLGQIGIKKCWHVGTCFIFPFV